MCAAPLTLLISMSLPLGIEINFSQLPGKGSNAPPFTMRLMCVSKDGSVFDSGVVECGRECGGVAVCSQIFGSALANGWVVSRKGQPAGDDKLVIYGKRDGGIVSGFKIACPHPVGSKLVTVQQGVWK